MDSVESHPGTATLDAEAWADATSRELLAIQAQNRKLPVEQRSALVERRLRERVGTVVDTQRRGYLRVLATRFPLPASGSEPANGHMPALTPAGWVAAFDSVKDGLSPELRKVLLEKLQSAAVLPTPAVPVAGAIQMPPAVEPLLPKDGIDPARVAQLLDVIVEAARALDGNFRSVWEGVADFGNTDHGLARYSFDEVARKFLIGDQDVPRVVLKNRVETTTKLIPAVLIAVKESWDAMEADVGNCLPEEVQKRVKKSAFGYEAGCWKEYTKAAEKLQPDTRVQKFFERIVTKARAHVPRR